MFESVNPDKIVDCNKKFPFKDSSVDEIRAEYLIEHLDDANFFLRECWRICKNKAKIFIAVPHSSNHLSTGWLFHKMTGLNAYSFKDYEPEAYREYYTDIKFHVVKVTYDWFDLPAKRIVEWFCNRHKFLAEHFVAGFLNLNCINFELEVVKENTVLKKQSHSHKNIV